MFANKFSLSLKIFTVKRNEIQLGFDNIYVVVNFLSQVIFLFLLFLGMLMYANGVETKEK